MAKRQAKYSRQAVKAPVSPLKSALASALSHAAKLDQDPSAGQAAQQLSQLAPSQPVPVPVPGLGLEKQAQGSMSQLNEV